MKRIIIIGSLLVLLASSVKAQFTYGTTGLLHMPTADMQRDKTFMIGGGYLNEHATPARWYFDTWNYYINITFFPWLEVAYTCTLFTAESLGLKPYGYSGFTNQDRNFSARLRLWKEGWWKEWTPQIVIGANDVLHGSGEGGDIGSYEGTGIGGNTFFQRYYIAATKHVDWYGQWGIHAAYIYSKRIGHKFNGPAFGFDYQFALTGEKLWQKAINGLNLMGEYDSKFVNIGARYTIWKDHINLITELRQCKYPSVGVYFKVHLK